MILDEAEYRSVRKGLRHHLDLAPGHGVEEGDRVRLRRFGKDAGIEVLVTSVSPVGDETGDDRVEFMPAPPREEVRFVSAGWPDYCHSIAMAMRGEPEPVPDTPEEVKERARWTALGMHQ